MADALDVGGVAGRGDPGQADGVLAGLVLEPWDDVNMEVEHGLPCRFAAAVQEIDAIGTEPALRPLSDLLSELGARSQVLGP